MIEDVLMLNFLELEPPEFLARLAESDEATALQAAESLELWISRDPTEAYRLTKVAVSLLRRRFEQNPRYARSFIKVLLSSASCHIEMGEALLALTSLEEAEEIRLEHDLHDYLGEMLLRQAWYQRCCCEGKKDENEDEEDDPDRVTALQLAEAALAWALKEGHPDLAGRSLVMIGYIQLGEEQQRKAMQSFREALGHVPRDSRIASNAMLGLGRAADALEDEAAADRWLERSARITDLRLTATYARTVWASGRMKLRRKLYSDATGILYVVRPYLRGLIDKAMLNLDLAAALVGNGHIWEAYGLLAETSKLLDSDAAGRKILSELEGGLLTVARLMAVRKKLEAHAREMSGARF